MADFNTAFERTMQFEGGYSSGESGDPGGETYRGIARNSHPEWTGWLIIDAWKGYPGFPLTIDQYLKIELQRQVLSLYKNKYWAHIQGDAIKSNSVANCLFDIAVNMGLTYAATSLQKALNAMNYNSTTGKGFFNNLRIDGIIGGTTLAALNLILQQGEENLLLTMINCERGQKFITIANAFPERRKFLRGWMKRIRINLEGLNDNISK